MTQDEYAEIDLAALSDAELTEQMHNDLYDGMAAEIVEGTNILLGRGWSATRVLDDALVAGMKIVGIDFRDGILFVPEVLLAANAMKAGMAILRPLLAETGASVPGARPEGIMGAVEAQVWLSDHETAPAARESAATVAVQVAQWCPRIAPDLPECDFWLGAALGVQARERPATGLSALSKIEAAFKRAAEGNPEMEDAGPDRALALLYLRAPRWPRGPGDPEQGLVHAKKAVALRPDYPPNRLALAEALAAAGDTAGSLAAGREALRLAEARAAAGDPDANEWVSQARKSIDGGGRAKRS
jgi:hypothetical protein